MIKFYDELITDNKIQIYLPFSNVKEEYQLPNSYYINSNGLLYNCFEIDGHKEANLIYTYKLIKDAFYDKKYITLDNNDSILLDEILNVEKEKYKRILNSKLLTKEDVKCYLNMNCSNLNDPLLIKLIKGIISSKIILLEKFVELEKISNNKKKDIDKIIDMSNNDINDILVRYCSFHKIES